MSNSASSPPDGATVSRHRHRVAFFETDAMGVVHHSNYIRHLELVRVQWLDEHDQPYRIYAEQGLHYATTHVEVDYRKSTGFDDVIEIAAWLDWVRGASLRMSYELTGPPGLVVTGATEHAVVDEAGRPRRIPKDDRAAMKKLAAREAL